MHIGKKHTSRKIHAGFISRITHLRFLNFVLLFAVIGTLFLHFTLAASAGWHYPDEADFVNRINSRRGSLGLNGLYWSGCITNAAREHAKTMSDRNQIYHSDLTSLLTRHCGNYGYAAGENVGGFHATVADAWGQYMGSPCHQANIDSRTFNYNVSTGACGITGGYGSRPWTHVGVGSWRRADSTISSVQIFVYAPDTRYGNFNQAVNANPVPAYSAGSTTTGKATGNGQFLRNSNTRGVADTSFNYGSAGDITIYCDWDGNGTDTVGVYRPSTARFYLRNSNTTGTGEITVAYGVNGDVPICGDWDGNGTDTVGVYRPGNATFYLRNSNTSGAADVSVHYGTVGDKPVVGDWDGNGTDTIGITRGTSFYLRNSNTPGAANLSFGYGANGDTPLVGDWDGNGTTTVAIWRRGVFYLRNSNTGGNADLSFGYGNGDDFPIVGDWDGNGTTTIGIIR